MKIAICAILLSSLAAACGAQPAAAHESAASVRQSVFYPPALARAARKNAARFPWAAAAQKQIVDAAAPWMKRSDEELWSLMFGNTIHRAWQVWSNGYCPVCHKSVPMYSWAMDALGHPWKARCPHCGELFPKNDFGAFYRSGLDDRGIFDPKRANRSLLFNTDHPDPADPLHSFGVDDGEGYVEGDHRWRFIGAYLIFGQWKQAIVDGIRKLAAAYVVTGDAAYAHKAGILLDRVADIYPTMDFGKQGVMYEGPPLAGYVSTWHDACEETREMALAYDETRAALAADDDLARFLAKQAAAHRVERPKRCCRDVMDNIEQGILRDALANPFKIHSNYPRSVYTEAVVTAVLGWPENRAKVFGIIDPMIEKATAVDGVTGEKGLTGYSAFTIQGLAEFLSQFARIDPGFLASAFKRHPRLKQTWAFFLDTWCGMKYYPRIGDTGSFAARYEQYAGVTLSPAPAAGSIFSFSLAPSMYRFLRQLYKITGDVRYVQALVHGNGGTTEGLPHDLFTADPERFQRDVKAVIDRAGPEIRTPPVIKKEWHLALLNSGAGADSRTLWFDYDSGGYHAHADGMNIGLFAKGLDLLPDFGYPPVQFGGWSAPRSVWYAKTAAHNTVCVDGKDQVTRAGPTTERAGYEGLPAGEIGAWASADGISVVRASCPEMIGGDRYDRTVAMIDISDRDSYILDIFRVKGGSDHALFLHGHFGSVTTAGLDLEPAPDYGHGTQMRHFRHGKPAGSGWSADWKIEDRYHYAPAGSDIHLRYTGLTGDVSVSTAESWVCPGGYNGVDEAWIPTIMIRRQAPSAPLESAFAGILEPYERTSNIREIRRLAVQPADGEPAGNLDVGVEVRLADGRSDLLLARCASGRSERRMAADGFEVATDGTLCWVRRDAGGRVVRAVLCGGTRLRAGGVTIRLAKPRPVAEVMLGPGGDYRPTGAGSGRGK
jgi:hypothetical protein